ncbi:T6SS amidase immunity protein Tai4 family protein [Pluralibacter gergoviae]|uniref:T6SS amidase immunity protein Tai4 family protein n=1 Tax=Pluralibacter gergoviae TaxID=61647 RepID=A0AAW8HRE1_PLUGE|nr:T6SS amidase immunity protein Tai4 family protein [Pluralibacter gergoviae]MDQ2311063.1 T6SS amidase immunity protein Tai4 family protein [Pluralibacter gergoviae]
MGAKIIHRYYIFMLMIVSLSAAAKVLPETSSFTQQQIFTHWVENRCIGKITADKALVSDANASAAAWLEVSSLPVEVFEKADAAIDKGLKEPLTGSTHYSYNVLKCTLIAQSRDIQHLYSQ